MGAELIIATCDAWKPGTAEADLIAAVAAAVASMSDETYNMIADYFFFEEKITRADITERAIEAVKSLDAEERDAIYILQVGSQKLARPIWLSGGMSAGDTPTESFDDVMLLDMLSPEWP